MVFNNLNVRNLLTLSFLVLSLFLFTLNSNADTFTVDSIGSGVDAGCNVPNPGMVNMGLDCECTDDTPDDCRVRSAVNAAANTTGDNIIDFDNSLAGIIDLGNTLFMRDVSPGGGDDNSALTVNGNTDVTLTISINERAVEIAASLGNVNINDIVISDVGVIGNACGSAIEYDGSATFTCDNCSLLNNDNGDDGAGICVLGSSTGNVVVVNSLIQGNGGAAASCNGCGINFLGSGNLTCTNSTFDDNDAFDGTGGAIHFSPGNPDSVFASNGCNFTNNKAGVGSGGALEITNGSANISGGNFTSNSALGDGGAVCVQGVTTGDVSFTNVTLTMNETLSNGSFEDGGAMYIGGGYTGTATISASTITNNTADNFAGGIMFNSPDGKLVIENGTLIDGNTATNHDGGGVVTNGETIIDNSTISNNKVLNMAGVGNTSGGVYFLHTTPIVSYIRNGSVISGNEAGVDGVAVGFGGGFTLKFDGELEVSDSTIENNTAFEGGSGGGFLVDDTAGILRILNSVVQNNTAYNDGGGGFNNGELSVNPSLFSNNTAMNGDGGGLYNSASAVTNLDCTTFELNSVDLTSGHGGAIHNLGDLTITSGLFDTNEAWRGGAIRNEGMTDILNTTFVLNVGNDNGGAISNVNGLADVSFCTFKDNTSPDGSTFRIFGGTGVVNLINSVLQAEQNNNCVITDAGTLNDLGFNTSTDTSCAFTASAPFENLDPMLLPLANNGGCIDTCLPGEGSLVKDLILPPLEDVNGNPVDVDAIGHVRPPVGQTKGTAGAVNDGGDAATLTITKTVVGGAGGETFEFTVTGPAISGACDIDSFSLMDGQSNTCNQLTPGGYTITEVAPIPGGFTPMISCDSGESGGASVNLTLDAGEVVTCTVTNGMPSTLTVATTGCTVTSNPGAINCGATCMDTYPFNSTVTLNAVPDIMGEVFMSWGGACAGMMPETMITLMGDATCTALCGPGGDDDDDDDNNDDNDDNNDDNDDNDDNGGDSCGQEGTIEFVCQQLVAIADGITETVISTVNNLNNLFVSRDLTIEQNLSVLSIFISSDEGLEIQNAFLEPSIGNCVEVGDGGPFPFNDENVQFECTITNFNMGQSVDLVVDVFASGIATNDDDVNRFVLYRLDAPELVEPLIVLQGFRVVDEDTGCTLAAAGTRDLGTLAVFALIPGLVLLRIFRRRLSRKD